MNIEVHAPSTMVLVVSLTLAVLAIVSYFVAPDNLPIAFWVSILAYVVGALGTMVKT